MRTTFIYHEASNHSETPNKIGENVLNMKYAVRSLYTNTRSVNIRFLRLA